MNDPARRVAVVGLGGVFPGAADPEGLWRLVVGGLDATGPVPAGRWGLDPSLAYAPEIAVFDRVYSTRGGFIEGFHFDPEGLDLDRTRIAGLDPMFQLALHVARAAWRDARTEALDRSRVGVILGNIVLPTESTSSLTRETLGLTLAEASGRPDLLTPPVSRTRTDPLNRHAAGLPAALIAGALGLGGGAFCLDAACASSLYAIRLAADALIAGRTDAMLTGGLSRPDPLYTQMGFSQLRALSASGRARPFDARGDGLIVGEGCGMFVLKRLDDALRHGDRIHGVIAGIGLSNDVNGGLLAPSSEGQVRAMRAAYDEAGWDPEQVDLIECHATGTPLGDAVEFAGLLELWGKRSQSVGGCVIGSHKGNIGHTLTASGAAGFLKVLLSLRHETLPPTANFATPASGIELGRTPFRILRSAEAWRSHGGEPRRAAVSGFGFGGINAHMLIEEWRPLTAVSVSYAGRSSGHEERDPVAIVGLAARVGHTPETRSFVERVRTGVPPRWRPPAHDWGLFESAWARAAGLDRSRSAGEHLDEMVIPRDRFRIPPREIEEMLPQQCLALLTAADALAEAGITPGEPRLRAGVFIGIGLDPNTTNFQLRWSTEAALRSRPDLIDQRLGRAIVEAAGPPLTANRTMGALGSLIASRVAREFRLGGPSFTVSSDETSGLSALAVGVALLRRGDLDEAVVGAVDLTGDPRIAVAARRAGIGPVLRGDGALALVLKRLADAQRDGDRILAVIHDVASASGGVIDDPDDGPAVRTAARRATTKRTPVSSRVRMERSTTERVASITDSAATTLGHLGAADGLAHLARAVVLLHSGTLPTHPGPEADVDRVAAGLPGDRDEGRRWLSVEGLGIGGGCIHVLLSSLGENDPHRPVPEPLRSLGDAAPVEERNTASPDLLEADGARAARTSIRVPVGERPFVVHVPAGAVTDDRGSEQADAAASLPVHGNPGMAPTASVVSSAPDLATVLSNPLLLRAGAAAEARSLAHESYLRGTTALARTMADHLAYQMALIEALATSPPAPAAESRSDPPPTSEAPLVAAPSATSLAAVPAVLQTCLDGAPPLKPPRVLNREQCLEFAVGSIGRVLGPTFEAIDNHPTRVRLPAEPLMLVDRITAIEGEPRTMTGGRIITEHDVSQGDWYLDGGRIPPSIAIESGQADLFLASWLGIDFQTRGLAVYRLLDATVTFHRELPRPGEVITYEITITEFFRQGDTHLFRFQFDGRVSGEPLLTMRDGCAGFFTEKELATGQGIVRQRLDRHRGPGRRPDDWVAPAPVAVESYSDVQIEALRAGDLASAFGPDFARLGIEHPARLPGGRMTLMHRVPLFDPTGGPYGLGLIRSELDIHPDDWFLTCHFVDDRVMPGTLMYECALHALRVFLTRIGWVAEASEVAYEPVPGIASRLRCRGQVTESTRLAVFEIAIKELGYGPEPFAIADAMMYADGKAIVEVIDMTLKLSGQDRERVERLWRSSREGAKPSRPIFTREQVLAFALGRPSEAFGDAYRSFDTGRFLARLPAPPYSFLDRVVSTTAEPLVMRAGGTAVAEYDVPREAWYFTAERRAVMPFAVLQEVALQACGWLAAHMGSALTSDDDLAFRNLGGEAVAVCEVTPETGTLTTRVAVTQVTRSDAIILQHYDFETAAGTAVVYRGSTSFGFFRRESLADQVGIRDAMPYVPTIEDQARGRSLIYPTDPPFPDRSLRMIDRIDLLLTDGGPAGLGLVAGTLDVDPDAWYFAAHFHEDPVCPGSLGLESMLQLLKVAASERWRDTVGFESVALGVGHRWRYRGQVVPSDKRITVRVAVISVDESRRELCGDGWLSIDGRLIYQVNGLALRSLT